LSLGKLLSNSQEGLALKPANSAITHAITTLPEPPCGLHIDGLTTSHRLELKELIKKKDKLRLAIFFAANQPIFQEVESLLERIQGQQALEYNKLANIISDSKNTLNNNQPEKCSSLTQSDIHSILAHNKSNRKFINKDFILKFGNLFFMENFIMYNHLCRINPAIFHIPLNSELRRMFETFVKTGLAIQGYSVALEDRLHILNLKQLQAIANEININKTFSTVHEAAVTLAKAPMSVVRLASKYPSDELFLLKQENWDMDAVEQEWSAYSAYAKLVCAAPM